MRTPTRLALVVLLLVSTARAAERPGPAERFAPDPASVQRYGPAYRYPQAGWIVLHIEGEAYERGYQHGRLLAPEIADYVKTLATKYSPKAPDDGWHRVRTLVNALFLRRFDREYLEEMKGTADGAAAAGAKFSGRALDLLDIVAVNSEVETMCLDGALEATANGLEGRRFDEPGEARPVAEKEDHCSAFAAVGPATADGKIVFGHITMFGLHMVRHFNVWIDIKPSRGHRVLMQTYPGGIQSGMDYYMNDAGLIVAETTIHQTRFDPEGSPLASRIRKTLQYADSIDGAVAILKESNNGLYTNEWLMADTDRNEIAMFELGTHRSRLWRSSKDEWFGGTEGFYWGCNNAKDLQVRLETVAGLDDKPANVVFHPADRDRKWLELYEKNKGRISAGFGFEAFTTPPLAAFPSCDAKFTTTEMARNLTTFAIFGPPLGRTWEPTDAERSRYPEIRPLVSNGWTVLHANAPAAPSAGTPKAVDLGSTPGDDGQNEIHHYFDGPDRGGRRPPAWRGTILPDSDADVWLASAFADYERIAALEKTLRARAKGGKLDIDARDRIGLALFAPRAQYAAGVRGLGHDVALGRIKADLRSDAWYRIASGKGVMLLAALRERMGTEKFDSFMDDFGRDHAGKSATTAAFFEAAAKAHGKPLDDFRLTWIDRDGPTAIHDRPAWSIDSFESEPERTLIVYGTLKDAQPQREAASILQERIARRWYNYQVPIKADSDLKDDDLKGHHLLLIGRPETNAVAQRLARLPIEFGPGSFRLRGKTYAHPASAVVIAGSNPADPRSSVVLYAGLGADATRRCVRRLYDRGSTPAPAVLMAAGAQPRAIPTDEPDGRDPTLTAGPAGQP